MPATYSINVGSQLEAYRKADILSVLKDIPDNTHKLISPKNIRDAFLSTWANSPFKQTKNLAGIEYIGIDSGNPSDRDIKQKIFLGKRTYANLDIMSENLLSNERADIYIYNTKPDSYLTQSSTKIAILAGTDSSLHQTAPYIESRVENGVNHLEFRNPSLGYGPINLYSSTGRVSINGVLFPTVAETSANAGNGKILKYSGTYPNGYLKWSPITFDETNIGESSLPTNIYGSPVLLNGHSMEFVENSLLPLKVGGFPSGFSFSSNSYYSPITATHQNWPLSEVLREILYPYVAPDIKISIINTGTGTTYAVAGSNITVSIDYEVTIYSRSSSEYMSNQFLLERPIVNGINGATSGTSYHGLSFSGLPGSKLSRNISFQLSDPGLVSGGKYIYTMAVSDVPGTVIAGYPLVSTYNSGWSHSATAEINFIKPIYYGFSASDISLTPGLFYDLQSPSDPNHLNQNNYIQDSYVFYDNMNTLRANIDSIVKPYPGIGNSMDIDISGSGYLYFIYPRLDGVGNALDESSLYSIKDPNGFVLYQKGSPTASAFFPSSFHALQSPFSDYVVWQTKVVCGYQGTGSFQFTFGEMTDGFTWNPVPNPWDFHPSFNPFTEGY